MFDKPVRSRNQGHYAHTHIYIYIRCIVFLKSFPFCFRTRRTGHTRISVATVQKTQEDKDRVQPQSAAETGTRVREKSLRGRRRTQTVGPVAESHRNSGECRTYIIIRIRA